MSTTESKVISSLCSTKDIHSVLSEDSEVFGPFTDVIESIKDYYYKFKSVPDLETLQEKFKFLEDVPTTAPTAYYMDSLKKEFVFNRMNAIMLGATNDTNESNAPAMLLKLQKSLAKLGKFTTNVRDLDITDTEYAKEHFTKLREISEANGGTPGISSGFKSIDSAYTTGFAGGHSIIAMGYTGRGKSMFAALLAVKAWAQGYKPMIISLEMSPEEQMQRVYAMMASGLFKISDLSRGDVDLDDYDTWAKKNLEGSSPFIVVSNEGVTDVTPNVVQAKIDTHRPDIVILDYLQLMSDNGKTQQMTPRMLNLSREIKMLATSNNIPIISITAVTDEDGDKRESPPVLSQVAWSKGIEYDANLAFAIHRHDDSNLVEIVCRKNRHGNLFDFFFEVDFDLGIWDEKHDI